MAEFNLRLKSWTDTVLEETIKVEVDLETFKILRRIIKDFLKTRKFL